MDVGVSKAWEKVTDQEISASRRGRYKTMRAGEKTKLVTVTLWTIVLLWMVLIFALSAQVASQSNAFSEKVTEIIVGAYAWVFHMDIDVKATTSLVAQFHHLVRKLAHGWIYLVLGILVIATLIRTRLRGFHAYALAIVFCISYAVIDEMHQTLVAGRSGQLSDSLIDAAGAIVGIGVYLVASFLKGSNSNRSSYGQRSCRR